MADTTLTKEDWKRLENSIDILSMSLILNCDGYRLSFELQRIGNRLVICWYVDNKWKGVYSNVNNEIGQKFGCPRYMWNWKKKEFDVLIKVVGKRYAKRKGIVREKRLVYYSHYFSSFRTLKSTLEKNCKSIEIVKE